MRKPVPLQPYEIFSHFAGQGLVLLVDVKAVRPEFKCNTCYDLVTERQIYTDSAVNNGHQFFPGGRRGRRLWKEGRSYYGDVFLG